MTRDPTKLVPRFFFILFLASILLTDEKNMERVSRDEVIVPLGRFNSPAFSIFFMTIIGVSCPEVDDLCSSQFVNISAHCSVVFELNYG